MSCGCGSIRGALANGATGGGLPAGVTNQDILVWNGAIWVPEARTSAQAIVAPAVLAQAPARTTLGTFVITKQVSSPLVILADASFHALLAPDRAQFWITAAGIDRHTMYVTTPFGVSALIPDVSGEWFETVALHHRTVLAAGAHTITLEATSVFAIANNIQVETGRLIAFELIE